MLRKAGGIVLLRTSGPYLRSLKVIDHKYITSIVDLKGYIDQAQVYVRPAQVDLVAYHVMRLMRSSMTSEMLMYYGVYRTRSLRRSASYVKKKWASLSWRPTLNVAEKEGPANEERVCNTLCMDHVYYVPFREERKHPSSPQSIPPPVPRCWTSKGKKSM